MRKIMKTALCIAVIVTAQVVPVSNNDTGRN